MRRVRFVAGLRMFRSSSKTLTSRRRRSIPNSFLVLGGGIDLALIPVCWRRRYAHPERYHHQRPGCAGGTPVFRGTRVPFQALLDYLEGGQTLDDFLDDFPTVTREAAVHVLEHAKSLVVSQLP